MAQIRQLDGVGMAMSAIMSDFGDSSWAFFEPVAVPDRLRLIRFPGILARSHHVEETRSNIT